MFLSNFLKYSSLNFILSQLYNIFAIYLSSNFPLLKSLSSAISIFSCFLNSAFILSLNSATTFFTFSKSFSLSQLLCSAVNLFYWTKYFTIPLIFLLFNILSTFHSSTPSTSTGFTSSTFCSLVSYMNDCHKSN